MRFLRMDESEHYHCSAEKDVKQVYLGTQVRNNRRKGSVFGISCFTAALAMLLWNNRFEQKNTFNASKKKKKNPQSRSRYRMLSFSMPLLRDTCCPLSMYFCPLSHRNPSHPWGFPLHQCLWKSFYLFVFRLDSRQLRYFTVIEMSASHWGLFFFLW